MSTSPPPPGSDPHADGEVPPPQDQTQSGYEAPPPKSKHRWIWPVFAVVIALGIAAGVVAANNKESAPGTVVNQQSTSTTNSIGVSVQSPTPTETTTVTAPTKTVTAPAQTVTAPAITAPGAKTATTPAP